MLAITSIRSECLLEVKTPRFAVHISGESEIRMKDEDITFEI